MTDDPTVAPAVVPEDLWVYVPMSWNDGNYFARWIGRHELPAREPALEQHCVALLTAVFDELGLVFDTETRGELSMNNLRYQLYADALVMSPQCFKVIPEHVRRLPNPFADRPPAPLPTP